jgi:aminomethyltransferase
LNQNGGIIDDLIVYRTKPEEYLLVVNASRTDEDFAWLQAHILPEVQLQNRSSDYAGLAIQGPKVGELFKALLGADFELPARNTIVEVDFNIMPLAIARTGYTGEDGVEVFFAAKVRAHLLDDHSRNRQTVRHSALRTRRARHLAPGNVLPAERQRSHARA